MSADVQEGLRMIFKRALIALAFFSSIVAPTSWGGPPTPPAVRDIEPPLGDTPLLRPRAVGRAAAEAHVKLFAAVKAPHNGRWLQLVWTRKEERDAREFWLSVVDLETGRVRQLPEPLAGNVPYGSAWSGGKFYFGSGQPGGLFAFDPRDETVAALGAPFENKDGAVYRMDVSPDGVIALGGSVAEVSTFDPRTGSFTRFGRLSERHNFVYELGSDNGYVYAALRGRSPWELVAVDKRTRKARVILTAPLDGYINARGSWASVFEKFPGGEAKSYRLAEGKAVPATPPAPGPAAEAPPEVSVDDSPFLAGGKEVLLHYQRQSDRKAWKAVALPATPVRWDLLVVAARADGRLVALGSSYKAALLVDPRSGRTVQAPMPELSGRCLLSDGAVVYASGYPGTTLLAWDTSRPVTPRGGPGVKAVGPDDPTANPRRVALWGQSSESGGHIGAQMAKGADGRVYIATVRHRYSRGFDLVWYDPSGKTRGEVPDGGLLDHLAFQWLAATADGKHLLAATAVQPNENIKRAVPAEAKLLVFDTATQKYTAHAPVPGAKALAGLAAVAPDVVVGLALDLGNRTTTVFRYRLADRRLEKAVRYRGLIQGLRDPRGVIAGFTVATDGSIWTGMEIGAEASVLLRIDPKDLTVRSVGRLKEGIPDLAFQAGRLFLSNGPQLREVPAIAEK